MAITNCGGLWPWITSLWPAKCCVLWPQRTVVANDHTIGHKMTNITILVVGGTREGIHCQFWLLINIYMINLHVSLCILLAVQDIYFCYNTINIVIWYTGCIIIITLQVNNQYTVIMTVRAHWRLPLPWWLDTVTVMNFQDRRSSQYIMIIDHNIWSLFGHFLVIYIQITVLSLYAFISK